MRYTFANAPINVRQISEPEFLAKYEDRIRNGKTRRDRNSGHHRRTLANRAARDVYVKWCADTESAKADAKTAWSKFPDTVCSGKGNSSKPVKLTKKKK